MAKINKKMPWDNCEYALFPFGKGMPICAYGVEIPEGETLSLKYFYHCCKDGKCRKELIGEKIFDNNREEIIDNKELDEDDWVENFIKKGWFL